MGKHSNYAFNIQQPQFNLGIIQDSIIILCKNKFPDKNFVIFDMKISLQQFYQYLGLTSTKFNSAISRDDKINKDLYIEKLCPFGFSKEFFCDTYIDMPEELFKASQAYHQDKNNSNAHEYMSKLFYYLPYLKNLDGSLFLESIVKLLDYLHFKDKPNTKTIDIENLTATIVSMLLPESVNYNVKDIDKIYKNMIEKVAHGNTIDSIELPENNIDDRNFNYTRKAKNVPINLLIIRELFFLVAKLENIIDYENTFYEFISISKSDYETAISTGTVDNRALWEKLKPYNFPATIFRSDNPAKLKMSKSLLSAIDNYFSDKNLEHFRKYLYAEIVCLKHLDNLDLVLSMSSIIDDIKQLQTYQLAELISLQEENTFELD